MTIIEVELIFAGRRTASPIQLVRHASSATGSKFVFNQGHLKLIRFVVQSNSFNTDIDGPWKVSVLTGLFRENVRAFFPQGQRKRSIIMRCPY